MPNAEEVARQIAVHEAVCAERWKHVNSRLGRIEAVLAVIVLLLLIGEALRANTDETSTPRKFTLEGDR